MPLSLRRTDRPQSLILPGQTDPMSLYDFAGLEIETDRWESDDS